MDNLFEKASRQQLRFSVGIGLITTEDLWELKLEDLNKLAKSLNKQVKEAGEEDFITTKSKANTELELKFELVKYVISVKIAEKEEKALRAEKLAKKVKIQEILDRKKDGALEAKSIEDLEAELAGL